MLKRVLVSGALGGVVLLAWTFVTNAVFGFTQRVEMKQVSNERAVYAVLKENVVEAGAYLVNPAPTPEGRYPDGEPVFSVHYAGFGHEAAGRLVFFLPILLLAASILASWLLSMASPRVLARYAHRVLFVVVIGVVLALFGDLPKYGIGDYPAAPALLIAANHVLSWALAGLVIAWQMRAPRDAVGPA